MSTTAIKRIDNQLDGLDPESLRYQVLVALRRFRSSWVELGRLLAEVARGGDYREWGYDDLEVYAARELGLKRPTLNKLLVSFSYMKTHESKRLKPDDQGGYDVPDYQTVELMHRVRENEEIDEGEKSRLHEAVFSGEEEEGDLRKELREHLRAPGQEPAPARNRELNTILRAARRLRVMIAQSEAVPDGLKQKIDESLLELEALE